MRTRQPRYKRGNRIELERPSPSYVVDVSALFLRGIHNGTLLIFLIELDAPSLGTNPFPRRYPPSAPFTPVDRKVKKANYSCEMDARRKTFIDWRTHWRIYVVEWNGFQL